MASLAVKQAIAMAARSLARLSRVAAETDVFNEQTLSMAESEVILGLVAVLESEYGAKVPPGKISPAKG